MVDNYRIGNYISFLRNERGLTGEKLAEQLGVSPQAVSKWENGKCLPETAMLPALSVILESSIDLILTPPKIIKKKYGRNGTELYRYELINSYLPYTPQVFKFDYDAKTVLIEDLNEDYISCSIYDEDSDESIYVRKNYKEIMHTLAKWHVTFWDNHNAFSKIGLDWRFETKENLLSHISMMEKDFLKYKKNEETGKIPKVWEGDFAGVPFKFKNNLDCSKLNYFSDALERMKNDYVNLVDGRFHQCKNITIIHGDLNPSAIHVHKSVSGKIKFDGLQSVRMGIPTEDLAMFIALHVEPNQQKALPLLDEYYHTLCKTVVNYTYEDFLNDYKIAIMENMFFTIRLINRGIYDFKMRDKAITAYESFILV